MKIALTSRTSSELTTLRRAERIQSGFPQTRRSPHLLQCLRRTSMANMAIHIAISTQVNPLTAAAHRGGEAVCLISGILRLPLLPHHNPRVSALQDLRRRH
jgi:hypothetical protein